MAGFVFGGEKMEKLDKYLIVRSGDLNCILHINPELEVICVKKGNITVKYEDTEVEVNENQAALVMPYRLHGVTMSEGAQAFVLMFLLINLLTFHYTLQHMRT